MSMKKPQRHKGSVLFESLLALPLMGLLLVCCIELFAVYKTKMTLNLAASEAARAGALNHARVAPMSAALNQVLAALYANKAACDAPKSAEQCAAELQQAMFQASAVSAIRIDNPTPQMIQQFEERRYVRLVGQAEPQWQYIVPLDSNTLRLVSSTAEEFGGAAQQTSLQDVLRLQIQARWCHKLLMPGLDKLAYRLILQPSRAPMQQACNRLTQHGNGVYVGVVSEAYERMQGPIESAAILQNR